MSRKRKSATSNVAITDCNTFNDEAGRYLFFAAVWTWNGSASAVPGRRRTAFAVGENYLKWQDRARARAEWKFEALDSQSTFHHQRQHRPERPDTQPSFHLLASSRSLCCCHSSGNSLGTFNVFCSRGIVSPHPPEFVRYCLSRTRSFVGKRSGLQVCALRHYTSSSIWLSLPSSRRCRWLVQTRCLPPS